MVGADNNTMSGRSEQVNTTLGVSSTYACYNCCPDSVIQARLNPLSLGFEVGEQNQFGFEATVRNCYLSRTFFQFEGFDWSSSDLGVGEISYNGWATAIDSGNALMTGYFEEVVWESNTYYCESQSNTVSDTGVMEVAPKITSISPLKGSVGGKISVSIDGTGFTSTTTIVPITGITFSGIQRFGTTSIVATFTISGNATAGNNEVKIMAGNQTSNGKNFFVQIPKKARRDQIANTMIVDPGPGNIVNANGQTVAMGVCGAYRNLKYTLVDQDDEDINLGMVDEEIGLSVTEILSNFQSPNGFPQPAAKTTLTNNVGQFIDILAVFQTPPCPPPFNFSATQKFKVVVGPKTFPLTTENTISISRSSPGQWTINDTIVTP